jgi:hypothetical protein
MANDNVVKCPLCGGFATIEKPELLKALTDPRIREQVENYIASLLKSPLEELAAVGAGKPEVHDFQKEVHSWNPCVPMWRRSPKE